jgi:glycerol uptake facilitator-like aquaporin
MAALLKFLATPAPQETKIARDSAVEFVATVLFVFSGTLSAISTGRKEIVSSVQNDVARILPIAVSFGISITALAHSIGHLTGGTYEEWRGGWLLFVQ